MLKVNVEGGEVVDAEAVNLRDIVFIACDRTGRDGARERDVLYESAPSLLLPVMRLLNRNVCAHCSRKFSNSSATFSPTLSTTLGTARAIGSAGRFLSVPRTPTTSSSGNPSPSLRAPPDSDGGIEERWALRLRPLGVFVTPFRPRPAARSRSGLSLFNNPSTTEDMTGGKRVWFSMDARMVLRILEGLS